MTYTRETITRRTNTMSTIEDQNGHPFDYQDPLSGRGVITGRRTGEATPAGLGAQSFEQALATTIEPPPRETSGLRCVRAESFRQDNDGDVMVKPFGMSLEVAIDDPLALLAVTMAAIKFGHGHELLAAAQKLVADFGKEPTR